MPELRVRTDRGDLSVTFNLGTFITDWKAASNTFMAGIKEGFRDLTSPRPSDFSATSSADLGEAWSKYRVFGGSSIVLLRAETLALTFPNILNTDYPILTEIVRQAVEVLLPVLGGYERHSYLAAYNYHVQIIDGHSGEYLARHASREIEDAAKRQSEMAYRPIIGFALMSIDGYRVFQRRIEQSEALGNGLFISNQFFVSMPSLTTFDEEMDWLDRTGSLANSVAGIVHVDGEADDDASA